MNEQLIAAAQQALEALESFAPHNGVFWRNLHKEDGEIANAIAAIRTAIEQAKRQQALDKMADNARELGLDYEPAGGTQVSKVWWDGDKLMAKPIPLEDFYQPAPAAPVQKPIEHLTAAFRALAPHCTMHDIARFREVCRNVLAIPPAAQRQWVGLEPDEILDALVSVDPATKRLPIGFIRFAKGIEAKLREKNGGAL